MTLSFYESPFLIIQGEKQAIKGFHGNQQQETGLLPVWACPKRMRLARGC
jgi:hypothetical protein